MTLHKQYSTGPNSANNAYDQNPLTISEIRKATMVQNILVTQRQSDTIACRWKPAEWCMVKTSSSITKCMIIMRQATMQVDIGWKMFNTLSTFD